jgi:hypothetical protein
MEGGKQIQSDLVDFVPHPPALLHPYVNLQESMEITFGSFRFLVRKEESHRFSASIFSGPLVAEHDCSGSSTSSIESGDEEVSLPHFTKPIDSGKLADLFGEMTFGRSRKPICLKIATLKASPTQPIPLPARRSSPIYMMVSPILCIVHGR